MKRTIPLLFFSISLLILMIMISPVSADILPPKKQISLGISVDDVICESGMFKVIKDSTNSVSCVNVENVSKLVSMGWAKPVDENQLNDAISKLPLYLGTINKLVTTPIYSDFGKISPKISVGSYNYVFDVCTLSQTIVSPSILIQSDSESKHYELAETVSPNSCITSAIVIKASNSDSITATLQSKGDISKTILSLSERVTSLKTQLADVKKAFGKENTDVNKQLSAQIIDLRKQLNNAREDLQRIYFTLYTPEKTKLTLEKLSFLGIPIEGESATKISVTPSASTPNSYNVVFEACAGMKQVKLPVIMVSSDYESINVKLGDKISPNTCQMSFAKITATDSETISVKPAANADSSTKANELEVKINDLQNQLTTEKNLIKTLTHNPQRPENFDEQLSLHVDTISKLRNDIISAKSELSKILYLTYR